MLLATEEPCNEISTGYAEKTLAEFNKDHCYERGAVYKIDLNGNTWKREDKRQEEVYSWIDTGLYVVGMIWAFHDVRVYNSSFSVIGGIFCLTTLVVKFDTRWSE
jgi:hypothetical protein